MEIRIQKTLKVLTKNIKLEGKQILNRGIIIGYGNHMIHDKKKEIGKCALSIANLV